MQRKVIWLFGLSGAGKSTIAQSISRKLKTQGIIPLLIDGDDIRSTVNKDLGYSEEDRKENIRRAAEFAKLVSQQNIKCICAFITPLKVLRDDVKNILGENVILFFIDTPLDVCIKRDPKGLYQKATTNKLKDFTGISAKFEFPDKEEKVINITTIGRTPDECADEILWHLQKKSSISTINSE